MSLYDGGHQLGSVYSAGRVRADADERALGTFSTINEAKAAIGDAAGRAALKNRGSNTEPRDRKSDPSFARKITEYAFSRRYRRGAA